MSLFSTARTLAHNDLRLFFRDRTGMLLGFLMPAALVTIFGYLMGLMGGESGASPMSRTAIWVADADQSEQSQAFVAALRHSDLLSVRPRLDESGALAEEQRSAEVLRQQVIEGEVNQALLIEKGFAAALAAGEIPTLTMVRDPGRQLEARLAGFGVMQALSEITSGGIFTELIAKQMSAAGAPEIAIQGMREINLGSFDVMATFQAQNFLAMEDHVPPERPQNVSFMQAQAVGGIAVMMVLFGLTAVSTTLLREREQGTMRRLLSLPIHPASILLGKALATGLIGLLQLIMLFTIGELLFKIGIWRDPLTLAALVVSTVAAATAFGLLIASWARTLKQAEGMSTLLILVMSCLGGSWFPLQILDLPLPIQIGMRLTINHWSVSGFQGLLWHTQSLADAPIQLSIAVLWLFTVVASGLALRLFHKRYVGQG